MSNSVFRIWSMTSQQFMVLKQKEGTTDFHASSSGTGKEESSKIRKEDGKSVPGENSVYLVFEQEGPPYYALDADISQNTVTVKPWTEEASTSTYQAFVPVTIPEGTDGPFKVLKVPRSDKCIASNKDGTLSLKNFDRVYTHPDTIFVMTRADY